MPKTYFGNLDFTVVHVASVIFKTKRLLSWPRHRGMIYAKCGNAIPWINSQNWQYIKKKTISTHVFTATASPLISRRLREGDGGAECAVNLAPILIALHVYVAENVCILSSLLYRSDNGALFQMLQVFTLNGKGLCLTFCSPCFFMSLRFLHRVLRARAPIMRALVMCAC